MKPVLVDSWWLRRLNRSLGLLQGGAAVRRKLEEILSDESIP